MRLIDADALKGVFVGEYPGMYTKKYIKNLIDGMPTVEMPRWVSVQDRLPEKDGEYLVRLRHGGMKVIGFTHDLRKVDDSQFKRKKSGWYEFDSEWGFVERDDITHYMPLPEPPKEVQDGT